MNSAGWVLFAWMPPTLPAAMIAASGLSAAKKASTAAWSQRSSSRRVRSRSVTPGSPRSRRTSAEPTIPWCPAMKSFKFGAYPEATRRWLNSAEPIRASCCASSRSWSTMILTSSLKRTFGSQPSCRRGLLGVAYEEVDLGGALVALVVLHVLLPVETEQPEGLLAELPDAVRLVGGDDVVVGIVLLEHEPHHVDVLLGVAPVAAGVEVAEVEGLLQAELDPRGRPGDLARDEGLAAAGRLVVEEDAVAGMEVVALAVVDGQPVGVDLRAPVGRTRPERRALGLRHLLHLAEHLRGRGLVVADLLDAGPPRGSPRGCAGRRARRRRRCIPGCRRRPGRATARPGCRPRPA